MFRVRLKCVLKKQKKQKTDLCPLKVWYTDIYHILLKLTFQTVSKLRIKTKCIVLNNINESQVMVLDKNKSRIYKEMSLPVPFSESKT